MTNPLSSYQAVCRPGSGAGAFFTSILVCGVGIGCFGAAMKNSRAIMPRFKELCGGATICRELKGIDTGKVLCSCENRVQNAVRAAGEALAGNRM